MSLQARDVVKSLCCGSGWRYGLFWGVNPRNSMWLTLEDAYFEETIRTIISSMLQQVHVLGEGIIGEAAITGRHQWMFSDASYRVSGPTGSVNNQEVFQDISEFHRHFSSGIKTIALVPVAPLGVVQFGSTEKISESLDFVDQVKYLFQHLTTLNSQLTGYPPVPSNHGGYDPSSRVGSETSCPSYGGNAKELRGNIHTPMVVSQPFSLNPELQNSDSTSLMCGSFHAQNQFPTVGVEDTFILPNTPQHLSQFSSSSANTPESINPMWSGEQSSWTMFDHQMLSGMGVNGSSGTVIDNSLTPVACVNSFLNSQGDTGLSTSYNIKGIPNVIDNTAPPVGFSLGKIVDSQGSVPFETESERPHVSTAFQTSPCVTLVPNPNTTNNLSHWVAESVEHDKNVMATQVHDNLSIVHGSAYSSGSVGHDIFLNNSVDNVNAVQSSLTNTIDSLRDVCDDNTNLTVPLPTYSNLFDGLGLDFGQSQRMECWEDYIWPVVSASHSSLSTGASECTDLDAGSTAAPQKEFSTDFRLEQLLEGAISNNSDNRPSSKDQLSPPTRTTPMAIVTGIASMHNNQVNLASHACLGRTETKDESFPEYRVNKINMEKIQNEMRLNALVGPSIDDSYSINTESTSSRHSKKPEETAKVTKKKGQTREGSRPRPKDRQQIQDRVKELREIVPTGAKCSIDALLDRTVKHILFLQSVLKYTNKLKNFDEPKIIGDENGVVLKDTSNGGEAIWAYGVAGQTMVCPMAEDMSPPGELSIEMRCDEGGYFLEIADTIRGFGLTILRGVMETEDDTIWARFTVEVTKDVTRMDIFLSLVQLVQQTTTLKNQLSKGTDGGVPAVHNYQQSQETPPVG